MIIPVIFVVVVYFFVNLRGNIEGHSLNMCRLVSVYNGATEFH